MIRKTLLFGALVLLSCGQLLFAENRGQMLLEKARQLRRPRAQFADQQGAKAVLSPDEKTFYLLWTPPGADPGKPLPMVVTIGGHGSWAFDDFSVWQPFLKNRSYGFLALQWWLGENEMTQGYLNPQEIYRIIDSVLKEMNAEPGSVFFHGFSRGAANTYPVAALDRFSGNNYFGLIAANAGKANSGYPPVREVEAGVFGDAPLAGTKWVTFAGGKDSNPARDGIAGMREAGQWIERYGGDVVLAIEDPEADHGGFHRSSKNAEAALDFFEKVRAK